MAIDYNNWCLKPSQQILILEKFGDKLTTRYQERWKKSFNHPVKLRFAVEVAGCEHNHVSENESRTARAVRS